MKVTPVLWTGKKNEQGICPIYLRIADTNKTRYASLGVFCRESQWNDRAARVRQSHRSADDINALISRKLADAESEMLRQQRENRTPTVDEIKRFLSRNGAAKPGDFFSFADEIIADHERRGQLYTFKRYKSIIHKFRSFTGEPLAFDRLTPTLLREFHTHLVEDYGNAPNTVATNFNAIRTILFRAIKEGLFPQEKNPFFHFKITKAKTARHKLSIQEIEAIEALDLETDSLIWHVRNYFLFSFYCAGIRFGDLARLKRRNVEGGRIAYTMGKTGTTKSFKLIPQAQRIADHYAIADDIAADPDAFLFPIIARYDLSTPRKELNAVSAQNALVNKYLKKIAERAGIRASLSFHLSRHSFADYARTKGLDVYTISKALGHSSIKVTENYLKGFDQEALDEKMESLFAAMVT